MYIRLITLLALVFSVMAAMPSNAEQAQEEEAPLSVEEILTREPASEDYSDTPRCINARSIDQIDVLDEKHVIFEVSRREIYLVRFKHRCPGLRRNKPVITEPRAGRLCRLDALRPVIEWGLGNYEPGPPCSIPGFESVTREQVEQLKAALKADKRKAREARKAKKEQREQG